MKSNLTMLVSAFLTASILTVIGGIVTLSGNQQNTLANASTQASLQQATTAANYQNLLDQANQTINQANTEILSLQSQLQQTPGTSNSTPYPVLPDQASAIASNVAGEVVTATPKLVNYNGKAAYEVIFTNGNVYVDANNGDVLFNGISVSQAITPNQAAQIAINYTGNTSVAGIVSGLYNNKLAYQVTFSNGEIAYVDVNGTVLAIQIPSNLQNTPSNNGNGEND
jgi:uncharacterized membrane protein YkoI